MRPSQKENTNIQTGIILSFICLLLLGIMPIISNSRPQEIDALQFTLFLSIWQLIFAGPVFLFEYKTSNRGIFTSGTEVQTRNKTGLILLLTGALFSLSTFLYVFSIERAGTVSASIAIQSYPLFVILMETLFLNKRKSKAELFFTILLVLSLYYLGTQGTWRIAGISFWFLLALSVPLIWSVAHLLLKDVLNNTPITPAQVTFFRVLISSIILFVVSGSLSGLDRLGELLIDPVFMIFAAAMGFVYYLELIIWFYAVKFVDVSVAGSITTPWPAVTALLAVLFLNESIQAYQWIALGFVVLCIYGILISGKKKRQMD